ncbi:hypothetical protein N8072_00040 [bacterium]|nr:hypothetical protein [bacterium]MDC1257049.1 hypothetical protein [bacterium]
MIRWYDYIAAFFAADFIWSNVQLVLFSGNLLLMFIGGIGACSILYIWDNIYTSFRLRQENNDR